MIDDDDIFFRANSNTRMFIQSGTGNVGIGAGTPTELLHVQGNIKAEGDIIAENFIVKSTVTQMTQSFSSGSTIFGDTQDDTHQFTGSLSVTGSASVTEALRLGSSSLSNVYDSNLVIGSFAPAIFLDDSDVSNLRHSIVGGGNAGLEIAADINNATTGYINFGVGGATAMRIVEGGKIGIGQTSPDGTLHVQSGHAGSVVAASVADDLIVENSDHSGITIMSPDDKYGTLGFGSPSDNIAAMVRFDEANKRMIIGTVEGTSAGNIRFVVGNESTAATIDSSGNVGIGTTSPQSGFDKNITIEGTSPALILRDSTSSNQATQFYTIFTSNANVKHYFDHAGSLNFATTTDAIGNGENIRFKIDDNSRISLSNNDNGTGNTIFGYSAATSLDAGSNYNTFIGRNVAAAGTLDDATHNIAIGDSAMNDITTADNNVAIGSSAMLNMTTATQNVAIGRQAMGLGITTGASNVAVGYISLYKLTSGTENVAIGKQALEDVTTGGQNVAVGTTALANNTATGNTAVGHGSFTVNTSGNQNVGVGYAAGYANLTDFTILQLDIKLWQLIQMETQTPLSVGEHFTLLRHLQMGMVRILL